MMRWIRPWCPSSRRTAAWEFLSSLKWTTYISAILEVDERLFPGDNRNRNSGPNKHTIIRAMKWVVLKFPCSEIISPSVVCIGSSNQSIHAMKCGCWRKSQKGDASPSRDSCVLCLCYSVCQGPCLVFSHHDPCLVHKVLSRLTWPVRIEVRLLVYKVDRFTVIPVIPVIPVMLIVTALKNS